MFTVNSMLDQCWYKVLWSWSFVWSLQWAKLCSMAILYIFNGDLIYVQWWAYICSMMILYMFNGDLIYVQW